MTTKSPDPGETGSVFAVGEVAGEMFSAPDLCSVCECTDDI
jgi:hypothetical protein